MSPQDVRDSIARFNPKYAAHWSIWSHSFRGAESPEIVDLFGHILRSWQAFRSKRKGRRMRRPKRTATHEPPYLEEVFAQILEIVNQLGTVTIREIAQPSVSTTEALASIWNASEQLVTTNDSTCVGISKATMLLTLGRIGPAFDSTVCKRIGIGSPSSSSGWLAALRFVSDDIAGFEAKFDVRLESMMPPGWPTVAVGRVYDMIAGPGFS